MKNTLILFFGSFLFVHATFADSKPNAVPNYESFFREAEKDPAVDAALIALRLVLNVHFAYQGYTLQHIAPSLAKATAGTAGGLSALQQLTLPQVNNWQMNKGVWPSTVPNPASLSEVALKEYFLQSVYFSIVHSSQVFFSGDGHYLAWAPIYSAFLGLITDGLSTIANQKFNLVQKMKMIEALTKSEGDPLEIQRLQRKMKWTWRITKSVAAAISVAGNVLALMALHPDSIGASQAAFVLAIPGGILTVILYKDQIKALPRKVLGGCQSMLAALTKRALFLRVGAKTR